MTSIRTRLLAILITSTGLLWLLAVGWIYLSTQAEVERVLDARLIEAARMVNSLLEDRRIEAADAGAAIDREASPFDVQQRPYERQLSCQIWSLDGALVGRSEHAPKGRLTNVQSGFSDTEVDGEPWRVYAIENPALGVRVLVGDSIRVREGLVGDVIRGLLLPAAVILPLLAVAIWLSVRHGMSPLNRLAQTIAARPANDLRPLSDQRLPREIAPAVHALNGLFGRVQAARDRERSFTAFAAHELKTPLAGLKTQAQIAAASRDPEVHAKALRQISAGVDRTSRLVRQLLDLAAIEASYETPELERRDPRQVVAQLLTELPAVGTRLRLSGPAEEEVLMARFDPTLLSLALRNLIENALAHTPADTPVHLGMRLAGDRLEISVEDQGCGIAETELPRVKERFFRGRSGASGGSGLGLSIADEAAARMGATLRLETERTPGLRAVLSLSAS